MMCSVCVTDSVGETSRKFYHYYKKGWHRYAWRYRATCSDKRTHLKYLKDEHKSHKSKSQHLTGNCLTGEKCHPSSGVSVITSRRWSGHPSLTTQRICAVEPAKHHHKLYRNTYPSALLRWNSQLNCSVHRRGRSAPTCSLVNHFRHYSDSDSTIWCYRNW